jgi:hypothetical protein
MNHDENLTDGCDDDILFRIPTFFKDDLDVPQSFFKSIDRFEETKSTLQM